MFGGRFKTRFLRALATIARRVEDFASTRLDLPAAERAEQEISGALADWMARVRERAPWLLQPPPSARPYGPTAGANRPQTPVTAQASAVDKGRPRHASPALGAIDASSQTPISGANPATDPSDEAELVSLGRGDEIRADPSAAPETRGRGLRTRIAFLATRVKKGMGSTRLTGPNARRSHRGYRSAMRSSGRTPPTIGGSAKVSTRSAPPVARSVSRHSPIEPQDMIEHPGSRVPRLDAGPSVDQKGPFRHRSHSSIDLEEIQEGRGGLTDEAGYAEVSVTFEEVPLPSDGFDGIDRPVQRSPADRSIQSDVRRWPELPEDEPSREPDPADALRELAHLNRLQREQLNL